MQKPESKTEPYREGGARARLFGKRKPQNPQTEFFIMRKPLLHFRIFRLEIMINRIREVSFDRMKARRGFGRK